MDREQALAIVKKKIDGPRYEHTIRVMDCAVDLAERFGADPQKAAMAAIFHDYLKCSPIGELKKIMMEGTEDERLIAYHPELWHGPAAAQIMFEHFSITDEDILNAIRFHTTGRSQMSLLEKIVYLADYIEPGRIFPGVEETRELVRHDLNKAVVKALSNTIQFLAAKSSPIFPDTFEAYNYLTMNMGGNHA